MFIHGKGSNSTPYILFLTRAGQKINYAFGSTGGEVFHRIHPLCNRGLKCLSFASAMGVIQTYVTLPAGKISCALLKEINSLGGIYDIRSYLSLNGSSSPKNHSCSVWNDWAKKSVVLENHPMFPNDILDLSELD